MTYILLDTTNSLRRNNNQITFDFLNSLDSTWLIDKIVPVYKHQVSNSFEWKSKFGKMDISLGEGDLSIIDLVSRLNEDDYVIYCLIDDYFVNEECLSGLLFWAKSKGCSICSYRLNAPILISKTEDENRLIDGKLYSVSTPIAFRVSHLLKILEFKQEFKSCRDLIETMAELDMNMAIYDDHRIENHLPKHSTHDIRMAETLYSSDENRKMWAAIEEDVLLRHE